MDPQRVRSIAEMRPPFERQTVKSFLGLINYYRGLIPNLSNVEAPPRKLVADTPFFWSDVAQRSFNLVKRAIAANTVLA